jgi:hypothetical protein
MGRAQVEGDPPKSRLRGLAKKAWWLHSLGALSFGVSVMIFARKGLAYADKLIMVLGLSWLLMFVALRFIVGPSNRSVDEHITRKGVRLVTNYIIKNLYQQMFFFSVPLYAASATWSLAAFNWWLPPLLLVCAVLSTMDLIFDNVIMEHRVAASLMYGLALFAVLNLMLPMVFGMHHFTALLIAAGATAPAVGLLTFRVSSVLSAGGVTWTLIATGLLLTGAWFGRSCFPPAPLAMVDGAVGHGSMGSYECLPGKKTRMRADQLDGLRCGSLVSEPGGVRDAIVHRWKHRGATVASRMEKVEGCEGEGQVDRSRPLAPLPADSLGGWVCSVETGDGQLVGIMRFEVVAGEAAGATPAAPIDAGAAASPTPVPTVADGGVAIVPAPIDAAARSDARPASDAQSGE